MGAAVSARLRVDAPVEAVYSFLAELSNHQRLADSRFRLRSLSTDRMSARIRMHGPLGIRRTAWTTITHLEPHRRVGGTATVGRRTAGALRWTIDPAEDGGSYVALTATVLSLGPLDRLLFTLGGRRWLTRGFHRAILLLAVAVAAE